MTEIQTPAEIAPDTAAADAKAATAKAERDAKAAKAKADRETAKAERDAATAKAKAERESAKAERDAKAATAKAERDAAKAKRDADKAKAAAERAAAKVKPELPAGYAVKYPHRTYLLVATDPDTEPKILVMCRRHGSLNKSAASITEADKLGAVGARPSWCRKCKAEATAKAAAAE